MWFTQSSKNFSIVGKKKKNKTEVSLISYIRNSEPQINNYDNKSFFATKSFELSEPNKNLAYIEMTVRKSTSQSSLVQSLSEVITEAKQELMKENSASEDDDDYEEIGNCQFYYKNSNIM